MRVPSESRSENRALKPARRSRLEKNAALRRKIAAFVGRTPIAGNVVSYKKMGAGPIGTNYCAGRLCITAFEKAF
jgi:hypothetical protein